MIHVQTHQVKILKGKNKGQYGYAALCDPMFIIENGERTATPEKSTCPHCIQISILKLEKRIEILKEML